MKLSEHFELAEFATSETATRLGILNGVPKELFEVVADTAARLEKVRALLGHPITISSGYRSEALEKVLCKKDFEGWCQRRQRPPTEIAWKSYFAGKSHPKGEAVDFTCKGFGGTAEVVRAIELSGIEFDQLIQEGTWVHIGFGKAMRRQVLTATFAGGTPLYSVGG